MMIIDSNSELIDRMFATGYIAEQLHKRLIPNGEIQSTSTFIAGCLCDLGKIDARYRARSRKTNFSDNDECFFDKKLQHNEVSVLLYHLISNVTREFINFDQKKAIKHALYWRYAKPYRKTAFVNYSDIYRHFKDDAAFQQLAVNAIDLLKKLCIRDASFRNTDTSILSKAFNESVDFNAVEEQCEIPLPVYKKYRREESIETYLEQIQYNADNNIIGACIISASRYVSRLSHAELRERIESKTLDTLIDERILNESRLCSHIDTCLTQLPVSDKQTEVAHQLTHQPVAVLAERNGNSKIRIALNWAGLKNAKQIIWICPRVQVCKGVFNELTNEYFNSSLTDLTVEINTGEFKYINRWDNPADCNFSGDIIITTIDQLINSISSHDKTDILIKFLNAHVVFDEFHEYIHKPALNLLFAELVACKQQQEQLANTLLISATPHYFYLQHVLQINSNSSVVMQSLNQSDYRIEYTVFDETKQDDAHPLYQPKFSNTIVISNTALTAQKSFMRNKDSENAVLLHSRLKKFDKQKLFKEVYDSFKKDGTQKFDVLRSGPIVQASMAITCDHMISELATAEDCLQRLGRLDRFGERKGINIFCIAVPESIHNSKSKGAAVRFLAHTHRLSSTKSWYLFLQAEIGDQPFNLSDIYSIYERFHQSETGKKAMAFDLVDSFKKGVHLINKKIIDPIIFPEKTQQKTTLKLSKYSLRGDNHFVQIAVCDINDLSQIKFVDEYACQIPGDDESDFDHLSLSRDEIEGYGDSDKNLVSHMKKKHHRINLDTKKAFKDFVLLDESRSPQAPIYLSYTPKDLLEVGGESARHSHAIYYAVCDKQPVGAISIKQLNN